MKKFLGIFVVLAMVLAMLPMTVFATSGTYELSVGFGEYIDLYADDRLTLSVNAGDQDVILTVNGEGSYYDWYIDNGMQTFYPDMSGSYKMKLEAGGTYDLLLVSDTSFEDQMLYVSLEAPEAGTEENPADLNMGANSIAVDGYTPYFFGFTATQAGKLEVAIDTAQCSDWSFQIKTIKSSGAVKIGDTNYSDVEPVISSETVVVEPGDVVTVCVNTANMGTTGTIYFDASFTAGDFGGEGEGGESGGDIGQIGGGDVTVVNETVTTTAPWTYTFTAEGPGSLRVVMGESDPGWCYKIQYPTGEESLYYTASEFSVGPDCTHDLTDAGEYTVLIWAYNDSAFEIVNGTISATLTYTPASGDVEIPKEEYVVSDILLGLGENSLTLDETAITTIYEFTPEETGLYKFTVGDSAALVGYWGAGSFFVQDLTENKTNAMEHELTAVGQSIMVGVSNAEGEFNMTIEKVGSTDEFVDVEYIDYIIKHVPQDLYLTDVTDEQIITSVDITKPQTVVKDENGFYHLGTVNGPLLYANLMSENFDITQAFFGGYGALTMRGQYTNSEGAVINYDFLNAMRNYASVIYNSDYENGLYPLTEDLMIFLKAFGAYQGWYNQNLTPFEEIKSEHNAESAWLVSCVYVVTPSDYRVAGNAEWLGNWAADFEGGMMSDMGNGLYQAVFSGVSAGEYELKVTKGGTWDENWGVGGMNGGNVKFSATEGQTVVVTFNAQTGEVSVSLSSSETNPDAGDYSVAALVVAMMAATAGAVILTKKKEF